MTQLNVKISKKEQKKQHDIWQLQWCTVHAITLTPSWTGDCIDNTNKKYHCWLPPKMSQNRILYSIV